MSESLVLHVFLMYTGCSELNAGVSSLLRPRIATGEKLGIIILFCPLGKCFYQASR